MNYSGDVAEQMIRISLNGIEVAARITGAAAKQVAVLLYAVLSQQKRTKGRVRMEAMLRSGKPTTVYSVKNDELPQFIQEAKKYGILYCAIRTGRKDADGMTDLVIKEEDAVRVNRIVERFDLVSVSEVAKVKTEIEKSREDKTPDEPDRGVQEKDRSDKLLDDLFGSPPQTEKNAPENPSAAKTEKSPLSAPISEPHRKSDEGAAKPFEMTPSPRRSVREELREIKEARQKEAEKPVQQPVQEAKKPAPKPLEHKQPVKSKQKKER